MAMTTKVSQVPTLLYRELNRPFLTATNCQPVQVRVKIISNEFKPKVIRRKFGLVTDESDGDLSLDELEALPNPSVPAPSARTPAEKMVNENSPPTILRNPRRDRSNASANDDSEMEISRGPSRVASPAVSALPNGHRSRILQYSGNDPLLLDFDDDDNHREILGIADGSDTNFAPGRSLMAVTA